ncbi:MAG: MFS transporter [Clostridia bacterium]|nr:MFS transporter [Clostridia bacterium]
MKKKQTFIFLILYLAYTSIYIARLNLSIASHDLTDTMGLMTTEQYGVLGGAFLVVYALGRLINGGLSDKIAPWIMLCTGLGAAGAANLLFSLFPPFVGMLLLWCCNAWAQSMLWSSVLCAIAASWDEQKARRVTSYVVTSVAAGNIVGIVANTWIITHLGLRFAFILPGGLTLLMGVGVFFALRHIKAPGASRAGGTTAPMGELIRRRDLQLTVPTAFMHGMMKDNITTWMTKYFIFTFAIDLTEASFFSLFIPLVGFVGRMLYPLLYKFCGEREHLVSVIGFGICAAAAIPLCLGAGTPVVAMICLAAIYAAVSLINTSLLSIYPIQFVQSGRVATISGIMDFATYLGAGVSSMIYGVVIVRFGYVPMYVSWAIVAVLSLAMTAKLVKKK